MFHENEYWLFTFHEKKIRLQNMAYGNMAFLEIPSATLGQGQSEKAASAGDVKVLDTVQHSPYLLLCDICVFRCKNG